MQCVCMVAYEIFQFTQDQVPASPPLLQKSGVQVVPLELTLLSDNLSASQVTGEL